VYGPLAGLSPINAPIALMGPWIERAKPEVTLKLPRRMMLGFRRELLKVRRGDLCSGSWAAPSARVSFGERQGDIWAGVGELLGFATPGSA
jgi:hypothetical protein